MSRPRSRSAVASIILSLILVLMPEGATGQGASPDAVPPSLFAIEGARIFVGPGEVIETPIYEDAEPGIYRFETCDPRGAAVVSQGRVQIREVK